MRARYLFVLAPLLVACRGATEITVDVSTDLDCSDHAGTTITVGKLGALPNIPTTKSIQCGTDKSIGTLVIIPSAGNDEVVAFQVTTGVGIDPELCGDPKNAAQCIVARRALRFIPHESLRVKVPMRVDCRGVKCDATSTCVHGACIPAAIDDSTRCSGAGCDETALGSGADGGITDAGVDASPLPGNVLTLALGFHHTCALLKGNTVKCWGSNALGALGIGDADGGVRLSPTAVPNLTGVVGLSAFSEGHSCAVMNDGSLKCWGDACCGQLGDPKYSVTQYAPVPVALGPAVAVAAGRAHVCALGTDRATVSCWGDYHGLPGEPSPVAVPGVGGLVDTLGSGDNLVVLKMKDGTVRVVGANKFNQLGLGNLDWDASTGTAVQVPNVTGVDTVANGNSFVIAALLDGGVLAWGESSSRQLGFDDFNAHPSPALSPSLAGLHGFALGDQYGCALDATNQVKCWGDGALGQLGPFAASSVTPVTVGLAAVKLFAGWNHTCAITPAGDVMCWGANESGQLGDGTAVAAQPTPKKVVGLP